jgi:hypothetical protein
MPAQPGIEGVPAQPGLGGRPAQPGEGAIEAQAGRRSRPSHYAGGRWPSRGSEGALAQPGKPVRSPAGRVIPA